MCECVCLFVLAIPEFVAPLLVPVVVLAVRRRLIWGTKGACIPKRVHASEHELLRQMLFAMAQKAIV